MGLWVNRAPAASKVTTTSTSTAGTSFCKCDADVVCCDSTKIVRTGMLRKPCGATFEDCFKPLPVVIGKRRTRLRADADSKEIKRSVEIRFPVNGKGRTGSRVGIAG